MIELVSRPPAPLERGDGSRIGQLREVARNFEAIFLRTLLKSMRSTIQKSGLMSGGRGEEVFTDLLDQRLAEVTAERNGGIGMARMIVKDYAKYLQDPEEAKGRRLDERVGDDAGE